MATVQVLRPFWWHGERLTVDETRAMSDDDARSLAHDRKVRILEIAEQGVQTTAGSALVVGSKAAGDTAPGALHPATAGESVGNHRSPAGPETPSEVKPEAG